MTCLCWAIIGMSYIAGKLKSPSFPMDRGITPLPRCLSQLSSFPTVYDMPMLSNNRHVIYCWKAQESQFSNGQGNTVVFLYLWHNTENGVTKSLLGWQIYTNVWPASQNQMDKGPHPINISCTSPVFLYLQHPSVMCTLGITRRSMSEWTGPKIRL